MNSIIIVFCSCLYVLLLPTEPLTCPWVGLAVIFLSAACPELITAGAFNNMEHRVDGKH